VSDFSICPCHKLAMAGPQGALNLVTTNWLWQGTDLFLGSGFGPGALDILSLALILMGAC